MLNLDTVKTLTIYTKKQIQKLYVEFKNTLNFAYETQQSQQIQETLKFIQLFYYQAEVPHFLAELNRIGQIKMTSLLEILYMKCSYWKEKGIFQKWVGSLTSKLQIQDSTFKPKPQILANKIDPQQETQDIKFFADYMKISSKSGNTELMAILLSFFRVFLINQLQNKKTQFKLVKDGEIIQEWKKLNESNIRISGTIDNMKIEQICVSISYWLCSIRKEFVKECIVNGIINFLIRSLVNKLTSEWYGKKIINFLKLLLLQIEGKQNFFSQSEFELFLAKFTMKYDGQETIQQVRNLFSSLQVDYCEKVEKNKSVLKKYNEKKESKDLKALVEEIRILVLYAQNSDARKQLERQENNEYFLKIIKSEDNLSILIEVLNLLAYNYKLRKNDEDNKISKSIVNKIGQIITNSKFKGDLNSERKKKLINLIRVAKQLLQNKQMRPEVINIMKELSLYKKFKTFSDCTNFKYERELFNFKKQIQKNDKYQQSKQEKQNQEQVINALVKNFNEGAQKNAKNPLEEDLQQIQLFYELIKNGQQTDINSQTVEGISKKIRVQSNETQAIQIVILDNSESQRNRELKENINFYAVASLAKIQQTHGNFGTDDKTMNKIIKIGLKTQDEDMLKNIGEYLQVVERNNGIPCRYEKEVNQIYRRNKTIRGDDYEMPEKQEKVVESVEQKMNLKSLLQIFLKREFKEEEKGSFLEEATKLSSEKEIEEVLSILQKSGNLIGINECVYLQYLLTLAHKKKYKQSICKKRGQILSKIFVNTENIHSINIIFSILTQIIADNIDEYKPYFQNFYNFSFNYTSKQSLQFTDVCLNYFEYLGPEERFNSYMSYIYNNPELIGREAYYLVQRKKEWDKFWQIHKQTMKKNIEEERKLPLHFFQLLIKNIKSEGWSRYELGEMVEKVLVIYQRRNCEIFSKQPSESLMRKLLRFAKILLQVNRNEDINKDSFVQEQYNQVCFNLSAHPMIRDPQSLKLKSEWYVQNMLQIILNIIKHIKDKKIDFDKALTALDRVRQYKKQQINGLSIQIMRVILLRNYDGHTYLKVSKFIENHRKEIESKITSVGADHLVACERIILAIKDKRKDKFKRQEMDYFFNQSNYQIEDQVQFSKQQLLRHLKSLVNPPYQYGLNFLQKHLKHYEQSQFSNTLVKVFIQSQTLYQQDQENISKTLQEVQQRVSDSIWGEGCELNHQFYKMISMNMMGLKVCLRRKTIGIQGVRITCDKMLENPKDNILVCTQILFLNASSKKELEVVEEKKIPAVINKSYKKKGKDPEYGKVLADFIGSSSKLKQVQSKYEVQEQLYQNLAIYNQDTSVLASTIYALSGLVFTNEGNQKILGEKLKIKLYLDIMKVYKTDTNIFDKSCSLLCNLIFKNVSLVRVLLALDTEKIALGIFQGIPYNYEAFKRFLRLIGNLALDLQAATSLIKAKFLQLWNGIVEEGQKNEHEDIIKYSIDIVFNLVNFHEIEAKNIAYKISESNCLPKILDILRKYIMNSSLVQSGLDAIQKVLILDINKETALQHGIIKCLEDISKTQSWNQNILQCWIRVLFSLMCPSSIDLVLESELFSNGSQFLKNHSEIQLSSLQLLTVIVDRVAKEGNEKKLQKGGVIDLYVQLLKIRHLPALTAGSIINTFQSFHDKKLCSSHSYIKIFDGLMSRLEIEFKDANSKRIIKLLVKIRDRIIINTKAAGILLEFGYIFLTQSDAITYTKYHKRVRQFVCLLSYFIAFNIELKIIFREEGFIKILQSWIKIDSSLEEEESSVGSACRVCIFSIQNEQRFLVNISEKQVLDPSYYEQLSEKSKCYLYRVDGSNKSAIIRWDKENKELVAYKSSSGEIKQKYKTPLYEIIGLRYQYQQGDQLLKVTPFSSASSIFQKNAVIENCITTIGLVGQQLSIRRFDVEFPSKKEKDKFVQNFKLCASHEFKKNKAIY